MNIQDIIRQDEIDKESELGDFSEARPRIEIDDQSTAYQVSEWVYFRDTHQRFIGTWEVL